MKKKCSKCGKEKSPNEFYTKDNKKQRRDTRCMACEKERHKRDYENNKDRINARNKRWCEQNKKRRRATERRREEKNRENIRERKRKYQKHRRKNIQAKLEDTLRRRVGEMVRKTKTKRAGSATRDLGCTIECLKQYLEEKFYDRGNGEIMNWDNYGLRGWHIDHIIPLSSFNLSNREEFLKACHYTNLQPMWAEENYAKGNKIL